MTDVLDSPLATDHDPSNEVIQGDYVFKAAPRFTPGAGRYDSRLIAFKEATDKFARDGEILTDTILAPTLITLGNGNTKDGLPSAKREIQASAKAIGRTANFRDIADQGDGYTAFEYHLTVRKPREKATPEQLAERAAKRAAKKENAK